MIEFNGRINTDFIYVVPEHRNEKIFLKFYDEKGNKGKVKGITNIIYRKGLKNSIEVINYLFQYLRDNVISKGISIIAEKERIKEHLYRVSIPKDEIIFDLYPFIHEELIKKHKYNVYSDYITIYLDRILYKHKQRFSSNVIIERK